jgi:hypothetical protein
MANFNNTAKCLLLSQGQTQAQDLLSKITFIHEHIPEHMRFPLDKDNREFISFKGNYSQIHALASTEKAGHGYQGSVVTRDEVARHPFAKDNFRAVGRAVDSGGKMIELSTANKTASPESQEYYFHEKTYDFWTAPDTVKTVFPSGLVLYTNPKKPKQCLVFLSWELRPVRTEGMTLEEWYKDNILAKYSALDIEEQYPTTIEDVFRTSGVRSYFESEVLDAMAYEISPTIKQTEIDTHNGIIRVYKPPIVGRRYIVYTDPSLGVDDPFVTRVKDCATGERVASASGIIKVDYAAQIHDYLVRTYHNAWNSFEYNGSAGGEFAGFIRDLNTPNQALRRDHEGKIVEGKKGIYMTVPLRKVMFEHLHFLMSKRQIINHDKEYINQARMIMRDSNMPMLNKKQSFDWVMADAGLEWVDKHIPHGNVTLETIGDL